MKIAIVQKSDLKVINWYEDSVPNYIRWNGYWGDTNLTVHLQFPTEETNFYGLKATNEGGIFSIAFDQVTYDAWFAP